MTNKNAGHYLTMWGAGQRVEMVEILSSTIGHLVTLP